jgi:hypothetical protein
MNIKPFDAEEGVDRLATSEEIRAALYSVSDIFEECVLGDLWEVESDLGGHVLIETQNETLTLWDPTIN